MSNLDKEREAFEAWASAFYGWKPGMYALTPESNPHTYLHQAVDNTFAIWIAGYRASLAAESKPIWEKLAEIGKDMPSPLTDDLDPTIHGE